MNSSELTFYIQEVAMHALGVEIQFSNFLKCLENEETRQTRLVWSYLSSFLSHAAMISKFVDPVSPSGLKRQRMNALRIILEVDQASEVLPRQARDNIEHFDERIDNWVINSEFNHLEIVCLDRNTAIECMRNGMRVKRVLAWKELIFFSENRDGSRLELELMPLFEEVKRIGNKAIEWLERSSHIFVFPNK